MKTCSKCGYVGDDVEFKRFRCKKCIKIYHQEYNKKHSDKIRSYREDNRANRLEYLRKWRSENKEYTLIKRKEYYNANKDEILKKSMVYHSKRYLDPVEKSKMLEIGRKSYRKNAKKICEKTAHWQRINKDKCTSYTKKCRNKHLEEYRKIQKLWKEKNKEIVAIKQSEYQKNACLNLTDYYISHTFCNKYGIKLLDKELINTYRVITKISRELKKWKNENKS